MSLTPLLILCDNHMDVVWRRGCRSQYASVDGLIRPYSDLEEEQLRRAVTWADAWDYRYTCEQSLPLKLFLERNPDLLPVVQRLVEADRFELPGGGETLIDLNLVSGESLVRNHLYSILWCERTFGRRPTTALGTDQFGYSAQYPQVLRALGYETLANSSRFFDDNLPYWRGLDGSTVLVRPSWERLGLPQVFAGGGCTRPPAPCCDGEGCPVCGYRGLDLSDENYRGDEQLTRLCERLRAAEGGPLVLRITGEETLESEERLQRIVELTRAHGFAPRFVTLTELVAATDGERLARLRAGDVAAADLYPGVEANPNCTGCYVSRSQLKLWNRRCESLLGAAETFAAFAWQPGGVYPRRKLERLWNDLALVQFHDAITGSHSDGAYDELLGVGRNVARGAHQVYEEAARAIAQRVNAPTRDGWQAAVVFNPLGWPVAGTPVDIVLPLPRGTTGQAIEVDAGTVVHCTPVAEAVGGKLAVRLTGLNIPAHGYTTVHWRPTEPAAAPPASPAPPVSVGRTIENEFYRVSFDEYGATEVFDKELGEVILRGAGGLVFEEDYGSVWETMAAPSFSCQVARHSDVTCTSRDAGVLQTARLSGTYRDRRSQHERHIARLCWSQELTLYAGVKQLYLKTCVDWDTEHGRLLLTFPLAFRTPADEAYYEIPFGVLPRRRYAPEYGTHTRPNGDWPAHNFVAAHNAERGYWVTIANRGTPCYRVQDGVVKLTLVRSPGMPLSSWDTQGAREVGTHVFETLLSSAAGSLRDANPVRLGREFNTPYLAAAPGHGGDLPAEHSFLTPANPAVAVSAVKRGEADDDLLVRVYEPYGEAAETGLAGAAVDLLERAELGQAGRLRPHELQTLRLPG